MAEQPDPSSADEFRELIRKFLSGEGGVDPASIAGAAGLPADPAALANIMSQMQFALNNSSNGIRWEVAGQQAHAVTATLPGGNGKPGAAEQDETTDAFRLAAMWLGQATALSPGDDAPRSLSRSQWIDESIAVWREIAEPVATSISDALTETLRTQTPEEFAPMIQGAGSLMRNLGGTLFAMQLGNVVGNLSKEVLSGGDVGIPLLKSEAATLLPVNVSAFAEELPIPRQEVFLYLAVRELAHTALFRRAKWLSLHLISSVIEYSRGIRIDTERIQSLVEGFDPNSPEQLREAFQSGSLIPPRTEAQQQALNRLEDVLALAEGWVDVVTAEATKLIPGAEAIAETIRRRRAEGGPAEHALATLAGLELRPRRIRDAAELWRRIGDAIGIEERDALWEQPDTAPRGDDLDNPDAAIARLTSPTPAPDDLDDEIRAFFDQVDANGGSAPARDADDSEEGDGTGDGSADGDGPEGSSGAMPTSKDDLPPLV